MTAHKLYNLCHVSFQLLDVTHKTGYVTHECSFLLCVSAADIDPTTPWPRKLCNESRLQWEVEACGEEFKRDMGRIDPQYWCNLTHFIRYDHM